MRILEEDSRKLEELEGKKKNSRESGREDKIDYRGRGLSSAVTRMS